MLARHRAHGFGIENTRPLTDGVVTGWGSVDGRKVFVFSQDFTRLRRRARRGVRREDPQGHGPRRVRRCAGRRAQRRRGRAHPGRRRLPRRVRRDLLAQREGLGRHPADQRDPRPLRGRRGVLARAHRLRRDGEGHVAHVHHRPRCREDRHRRGRHAGAARRRDDPRVEVGRRRFRLRRRAGRARAGALPALVPPRQQPRGPAVLRVRRRPPTASATGSSGSSPTRRTSPTT